ncbi:MAG: N-acetylmuramoyl-L-alanine amidase, partial [Pseudomonadota bacterium]|nr:N-acetylmuramoyl-L-alanine amidase [Pseudomonadota bacterium]
MPGFRYPGSVDRDELVLIAQTLGAGVPSLVGQIQVDFAGYVRDPKVKVEPRPMIDHGPMAHVNGIIVHQTGGATARSALDSYLVAGANGAHFLIDKDGTIYQTASVFRVTHHVGYLKPRCRVEMNCTPAETRALAGKRVGREIGRVEAAKAWPARFPGNSDAIGIELVGAVSPKPGGGANEFVYEPVKPRQQQSFNWLLARLLEHFHVNASEVFRHPDVSWK